MEKLSSSFRLSKLTFKLASKGSQSLFKFRLFRSLGCLWLILGLSLKSIVSDFKGHQKHTWTKVTKPWQVWQFILKVELLLSCDEEVLEQTFLFVVLELPWDLSTYFSQFASTIVLLLLILFPTGALIKAFCLDSSNLLPPGMQLELHRHGMKSTCRQTWRHVTVQSSAMHRNYYIFIPWKFNPSPKTCWCTLQ